MEIIQHKITVLEPITQNTLNLRIIGNSVIFRNAGTAQITIDYGWTIAAGESIAFNLNNRFDVLAQNFSIVFAAGGVNRLETAVISVANCPELDSYVQNIKVR